MSTETTTELHAQATTNRSGQGKLRAVLVGFGLMVAATLAVSIVTGAFQQLQLALGYGDDFLLTFAVGGTLATLSLGAIAVAYLRIHPIAVPVRWLTRREWGWVVVGLVAPFVVEVVVSIAAGELGVEPATNGFVRAAAENPVLVYGLGIVLVLVLVAPLEELLYRGVVQGRFRESFGPAAAIGLTALGFGAGHVVSYLWGGSELLSAGLALSLVPIVAGGLVLGYIYERTGNLAVVVLAHGLYNATLLSLAMAMAL